MKKSFGYLMLVLMLSLSFSLYFACGDDDDDDDDDFSGSGSVDCQNACDGVMECGGQFWYEDKAECVSLCGDWEDISAGCAECFFNCWDGSKSCLGGAECMASCGLNECVDAWADWESYL